MTIFERSVQLPVSQAAAWRWHLRSGALARLTPPWEPVTVHAPAALVEGAEARLSLRMGPLSLSWLARIAAVEDGRRFIDEMMRGPFARWRHEHLVAAAGEAAELTDRVDFRLPLEPLSVIARPLVVRRLDRMFRYRHAIVQEDLRVHETLKAEPMRIGITGSRGFVGKSLAPFLDGGGHTVVPLGRRPHADDLRGLDAVVHLAAEPLFAARWTTAKKRRIYDSRADGTHHLAATIASLPEGERPRTLVSASAIGYFGARGDEVLDEDSTAGSGFPAEVAQAWERATRPAADAGVRVVNIRFGVLLGGGGGALPLMALPFQLGVGGPLGDPDGWLSWISLDDALDVVLRCLVDERVRGPVLAVRGAVTQRELAQTIGRVLHRPSFVRVPTWALRIALGREQAEWILSSLRVQPRRLQELGHTFRHDTLEHALAHAFGRERV